MTTASTSVRDNRYANQHDPIYHSLDSIPNWLIYGHLTFPEWEQGSEAKRVKKFHTLIRNTARRFAGKQDLNGLGWFLRQEGNSKDKLYHFHFAITDDKFSNTTPDAVCRYMAKQWAKIGKTRCQIEPWNPTLGPRAVWYNTQYEPYQLRHSTYFGGDVCHWRMSPRLNSKIKQLATQGTSMKTTQPTTRLKKIQYTKDTFFVGGNTYPFSQLEGVMQALLSDSPLPTPLTTTSTSPAEVVHAR